MIKEFKKIWNQDRSTKKDKALKELAYVYHSCDYQSIYRNYHLDTRDSKIKLDIFDDRDHKITMPIIEAMDKYQALQTTLSMELLHDVELGLTKLRDYFKVTLPRGHLEKFPYQMVSCDPPYGIPLKFPVSIPRGLWNPPPPPPRGRWTILVVKLRL